MKERLVKFDTAKLAKEKGFDEWCYAWYYEEKLVSWQTNGEAVGVRRNHLNSQYKDVKFGNDVTQYSAPTVQFLHMWLLETHQKFVEITLTDNSADYYFEYVILDSKDRDYDDETCCDYASRSFNIQQWPSYEDALEAGLFEALDLITDK